MRKRIIAFYDLLFYAIICGPLIVVSILLLSLLVTKGTSEWIYKNWYLLVTFAVSFMLSVGGAILFRYCVFNNNSIHFHYFPFTTSWEKAANNIDILWNQNVFISEVSHVEFTRLTAEEKKTKVFYKHWFNKYLKISLIGGKEKYVYVGNYSSFQVKKIIKLLTSKNT